jgi:hypothetical protein
MKTRQRKKNVMNTSNRFNMETLARQRQAEREKHIQNIARLRNAPSLRHSVPSKARRRIGVASLSILGLIGWMLLTHLP